MQWKKLNYSIFILFNLLLFSCNTEEKSTTNNIVEAKVERPIDTTNKLPESIKLVENNPSIQSKKRLSKPIKLNEYLDNLIKKQEFVVDPKKEIRIKCETGTEIIIPPNVLVNKSGEKISSNVKISVKEYYSKSDFILGNLNTTCGSRLIESGGMINIEALAGKDTVYMAKGSNYELKFPNADQKPGMELFYGNRDENGIMNWEQAARKEIDPKLRSQPFWGNEKRNLICNINLAGYTTTDKDNNPYIWSFQNSTNNLYNYFTSKVLFSQKELAKYCGSKFIMEITFALNKLGKVIDINIDGNEDEEIRNRLVKLLQNMPAIDLKSMSANVLNERFYLCFRNVYLNETKEMIVFLENKKYRNFFDFSEIEDLVNSNNLSQFNLNDLREETREIFSRSNRFLIDGECVPDSYFSNALPEYVNTNGIKTSNIETGTKEVIENGIVKLYPYKFGFINCDRFIEQRGRRYNIEIPVASKNATVFMVVLQYNSIISGFLNKDNYLIRGIPKNTPAIMVVYYEKDNKYYFSSEMISVDGDKYEPKEYQELNREELISEIKTL